MTLKILGTGSSVPQKTVTNKDLEQIIDTSDEWIKERTGISERRIAINETTTSMSANACLKALEDAGVNAEDVELIIAASVSPDYYLPCLACEIQRVIGAKKAVAFDLNAACSGFLFGLNTAEVYIKSGVYKNALIIGAETLSKIVDWTDRGTCVLFGDGAGAVYVEASEKGVLGTVQGADGFKGMALNCPNRETKNFLQQEVPDGFDNKYVKMEGQEVYKFAVRQVPLSIKEVCAKAELTKDDIKYYILHQANIRIIEAIAKRLGEPLSKFPVNLDRYGNTSAASIPILLDEVNKKGMLQRGDKIVLSGFGAGLTYGATVLEW